MNHKLVRQSFWVTLFVFIGCLLGIYYTANMKPIVPVTFTIACVGILVNHAHIVLKHGTPPEFKNLPSPKPSKGTSNADKMGYHPDRKYMSVDDKDIKPHDEETLIKLGDMFEYEEPIEWPYEIVYDRLLTDDELLVLEEYYHGFYHSIGVIDGEILLSNRANGRATHYTTPDILADVILMMFDEDTE